jgi:hypothetical protein
VLVYWVEWFGYGERVRTELRVRVGMWELVDSERGFVAAEYCEG